MSTSLISVTPPWASVDYAAVLKSLQNYSIEEMISSLKDELPFLWKSIYLKTTLQPTDILSFQHETFEYIYDDYGSLEASGKTPYNPNEEGRLIAVMGCSVPRKKTRDDYRLKGWIGPTESTFGAMWDKGHFIAHSIGGAIDGIEANVFIQRRDLNRGWSDAGKQFRKMEKYCFMNPGTFCFNRPLYLDGMSKPAFIEFGLLKKDNTLWVECFNNLK